MAIAATAGHEVEDVRARASQLPGGERADGGDSEAGEEQDR
jgi:hypothetical protein